MFIQKISSVNKLKKKIPGYEPTISSKANKLHEELYLHYYTFVDLEEWKTEAISTLNEVAKSTSSIKVILIFSVSVSQY